MKRNSAHLGAVGPRNKVPQTKSEIKRSTKRRHSDSSDESTNSPTSRSSSSTQSDESQLSCISEQRQYIPRLFGPDSNDSNSSISHDGNYIGSSNLSELHVTYHGFLLSNRQ